MRKGTVIIKLPYPVKIGFFTVTVNRKIGFSFNQRSMLLLLENNDIDLPDHSKWMEKVEKSVVVLETLYAAAQSYRMGLRVKDNFKKKGLIRALTDADEDVMQQLMDAWDASETFGYKKLPGKKKAKKH